LVPLPLDSKKHAPDHPGSGRAGCHKEWSRMDCRIARVTFGPTGGVPPRGQFQWGHRPCAGATERLEPAVILVEEMQSEVGGGGETGAIRDLRLEVDRAWRNDVALEMWIDVTSNPVSIRLAGVLDESTGANLLSVVRDCVAQGRLDFDLDTSGLRIDATGWQVIDRLRRQIHDFGGQMHGAPN
jgi:hypothetical protein